MQQTLTLIFLYVLYLIGGNTSIRRFTFQIQLQSLQVHAHLWSCQVTDVYFLEIFKQNETHELTIQGCLVLSLLVQTLLYENYLIYTTIIFSLVTLLESDDQLVTFIAQELLNLSLYLYISSYTSGVKYFLLSGVVTTLFLIGMTSIYSTVGQTHYEAVSQQSDQDQGAYFFLVLFFKQGIFPFHGLTADQYDGLPTPQMALFQIPVKYTYQIQTTEQFEIQNQSSETYEYVTQQLMISMVQTAVVLSAQYTFKRFLAISSVSYQSMLLIQIMTGMSVYYEDIQVYLFVYFVSQYMLLISNHPQVENLVFFSIAGLPPQTGFYTKLYQQEDQLIYQEGWSVYLIQFQVSSQILTANYLGQIVTHLFKKVVKVERVPSQVPSLLLSFLTLSWQLII